MTTLTSSEILAKIDKAVGPPEAETPEERSKRVAMVDNLRKGREIRKNSA